MKYPVGTKLVVKEVYSGGNFCVGDIVTVSCIVCDDDLDCYAVISPHDGLMWYLREDEVAPCMVSDYIRGLSKEELAKYFVKHKDLTLHQWLTLLDSPMDHFDSKIVPKTFSEAINVAYTQYPEASASELETVAEEILEQRTKNS